MKIKKYTIYTYLLVFILGLSSCIKEDLSNCSLTFTFDYTYNLEQQNKIDEQLLDRMQIFMFDKNGVLRYHFRKNDQKTIEKGFQVTNNAFEPGEYKIVVATISSDYKEDKSDFLISNVTLNKTLLQEFKFFLNHQDHQSKDLLNNFLVSSLPYQWTSYGQNIHVSLRKINKRINIELVIPNNIQTRIEKDQYSMYIKDKGVCSMDGNLDPTCDKDIIYHPCQPYKLTHEDDKVILRATFNTSRLIYREGQEENTQIIVKNNTTNEYLIKAKVFRLIEEGAAFDDQKDADWGLQEYIDRREEYSFSFYIDEDGSWLSNIVNVNGWDVSFIDLDM